MQGAQFPVQDLFFIKDEGALLRAEPPPDPPQPVHFGLQRLYLQQPRCRSLLRLTAEAGRYRDSRLVTTVLAAGQQGTGRPVPEKLGDGEQAGRDRRRETAEMSFTGAGFHPGQDHPLEVDCPGRLVQERDAGC